MPVGKRQSYRIRGARPEGSGASLDEALAALLQFWESRRSLAPNDMGNLNLTLTIGGRQVTIEITDVATLQRYQAGGDADAIREYVASRMGLPQNEADLLLSKTSSVIARVDTIAVPQDPKHWQPEPDLETTRVFQKNIPDILAGTLIEMDRASRRGAGRARSPEARALLERMVEMQSSTKSDAKIAKETGLSRETVRDARHRVQAKHLAVKAFKDRKPGQRLTSDQREVVKRELEKAKGNAAEAARALGLPEKTVRDFKRSPRAKSLATDVATPPRRRADANARTELLRMVERDGLSATEAARRLGVAERTARGWVRERRRIKDDD